uniref:Uncharacterized protein n=1 Tax=Romanomermis culicivorax TaxID=13658 RepID=A0A915IIB2_ROMCU
MLKITFRFESRVWIHDHNEISLNMPTDNFLKKTGCPHFLTYFPNFTESIKDFNQADGAYRRILEFYCVQGACCKADAYCKANTRKGVFVHLEQLHAERPGCANQWECWDGGNVETVAMLGSLQH